MGFFNKLFSREKKETLDGGLERTKEGLLAKLAHAVAGKSRVDDEVLDNLEEVFVTSDVGVETTLKIIDRLHARRTSLQPLMTLLPERCTATVNVYHVSFQTDRWGSRFYGVLCVPKKEGKYPALLRVPGAGIRPYAGDVYTAEQGAITLEVGIHGIPVTMEQSFYDNLMNGALNGYWTFCRNDLRNFYYHRVIIGALRAVDFICALPQYNGQALGVTGSSQGGALSVMTAALDPRVTFFAAVHPALCDHEAFMKKRACGWPHYFYYYGAPDAKELEVVRYYDTANFARCLTVSGWFSWGYNDDVCPPTSMYAAYNAVTSPKELHPYLETGHYWYQEQWDEWLAWLWKQMGIGK